MAYYLRQNLTQVPLISPNYSAGCERFRDGDDTECDIFLYNEQSQSVPGGVHHSKSVTNNKGIACISLSIVDGAGNIVKHFSQPKPTHDITDTIRTLEEMIETDVFDAESYTSPGPGPIALIQFKIWESGRLDFDRLISALHSATRQSMWDTVMEYRLLSAPLCINIDDHEEESETTIDDRKMSSGSVPEIVIDANDLVDDDIGQVNHVEDGTRGVLHKTYSSGVVEWINHGLDLRSCSVFKHSVNTVASNSVHILLKEMQSMISSSVPDLQSRLYQHHNSVFVPYNKNNNISGEFILVSRNIDHWRLGTDDKFVDPSLILTRHLKMSQQFSPLILESSSDQDQSLLQCPHSLQTPVTPTTPAPGSSGLSGLLETIRTTEQVFIPRQRLVVARVNKHKIEFFFYNLSRDTQVHTVS